MEVKRGSSHWLKTQGAALSRFPWQGGYGAFSVSQSGVKEVSRYIEGQATHHRVRTFQEEFQSLPRRYGVAFDEKYLWT